MTCETAIEAHRRINAMAQAQAREQAIVLDRCRLGLHVTIPIVREHVGDIVYATTCCDRLFAVTTLPGGLLKLIELQPDREQLAALRGELDAGTVATGERLGQRG